jgi:hypothetical protein
MVKIYSSVASPVACMACLLRGLPSSFTARQRSPPQADEIKRLRTLPAPGRFPRMLSKQARIAPPRVLACCLFGDLASCPLYKTMIENSWNIV